jgi:hypothetical protein
MRNGLVKTELQRSEDARHSAESELTNTKELMARNAQVLADSMERSRILEEELGQIQGAARSVVIVVLEPRPRSSAFVADLSEIPGEVAGLITHGFFHGASGVLTLVESHHQTLDFEVVRRGYTAGWSANQLRELGQSLVPVVTAIEEATTAKWVKEAHHVEREATLGRGGVQSIEAESSAAPTGQAPNHGNPPVDPTVWLLPSTSSANADAGPWWKDL